MRATAAVSSAGARRWVWLILTILGVAVFARLGWWQLDRAHQKEAWVAALDQAASAAPLDNAGALQSLKDAAVIHRRVHLRGQWMPEHAVYLENRTMGGGTGFVLVMPLAIAPGVAVVVQRGWIPRHQIDPKRLAPVDTPSGEVEVDGVVSIPPSHYFSLGDGVESGRIRSNLDWLAYGQQLHREIGVWSVRATGGASEGLRRNWDPIDAKIPTHYGYAAQWFALAALTVMLYVWFQILQPRRKRA